MPYNVPDVPRPNKFQKWLLLASISIVRRFRNRTGSVLMLTSDLCVKYGSRLDVVEAQTMLFIAKHTSIPVPKIYFAFTDEECTYILMERIHGHSASRGWVRRSDASKQRVLEALKKMVLEMRGLISQSNAICSVSGGSLYDMRIPMNTRRFGPFDNVQEFHNHLRNGKQTSSNSCDEYLRLFELHSHDWSSPTFTHGDLSSLNILVRGDDVVGIIDWETAGWYPPYWEYTTACQVNPRNPFWRDEIEKFLEEMPEALEMDQLRQKYFGDWFG
ncbi:kinase-like protein [Aureobasidium melanogenum CBS 110374]|uniref:Kinase-like protein n=1 Tax=Aureobasidium melanogenum (strain CBS 110374) TaxID=1043003 RepID=A0A074WPJ2_AURM1|nr:kinase-like protein [Aureobasidium melanogenum CBS 110374]KEQ64381.1 kinase-like protein [Aureobasidium melanogenum CBS 110374]